MRDPLHPDPKVPRRLARRRRTDRVVAAQVVARGRSTHRHVLPGQEPVGLGKLRGYVERHRHGVVGQPLDLLSRGRVRRVGATVMPRQRPRARPRRPLTAASRARRARDSSHRCGARCTASARTCSPHGCRGTRTAGTAQGVSRTGRLLDRRRWPPFRRPGGAIPELQRACAGPRRCDPVGGPGRRGGRVRTRISSEPCSLSTS